MGDLELPRAEDRLAPDRPVATEWGEGGRPLVFWPGLNPWGELQLVEVGPLLAEQGFHVISLVPPIRDDPDAYLPTRLAKHVLEVADGQGIDGFIFMGHSWGASIGVHLAADHPDRVERLILLDAGHTDVREVADRDATVAEFEAEQAAFEFDSWDDFLGWVERERVREWRPALEDRYRAGMVERDGKIVAGVPARVAAWALHGVSVEPPSAKHRRLLVPTLLIVADGNEHVAELEQFRRVVPHAHIETLESGHDVPEDAPGALVSLVSEWAG